MAGGMMLTPMEVARIAQAAKSGATKAAVGAKVSPVFLTNDRVLELIAGSREGGEVTLVALGRHTWSFIVPTAAGLSNDPVTVGLWHLNDSAADASANGNTLTLHNTSYVAAHFSNGLSFNGTTAYAECALESVEPIRQRLYVSAWVKPTSDGPIIDWPGIAKLYIDGGVLKADFGGETFTGPAVTNSTWQLCHAQFDTGDVWVGVNEIFTRDEATFQQFTSTARAIQVGYDDVDYLAAVVDEIRIQADSEVSEDIAIRPAYPGMGDIGQWRFNENYGRKAHPVGMANAPTITMVGNTWAAGYEGYCTVFGGSAYGTFPKTADTATKLSIELIMQFAAGTACTIIDQQDGINFAYTGTHFRAALNGVTNPASDIAPFTPTLDTWYTLSLTYDGVEKAVWLNGQKIGEAAATGTVNLSANAIHIAETYAGASRFNGKVDTLLIAKYVARPYYRPVRRWLIGRQGFAVTEDWVLL